MCKGVKKFILIIVAILFFGGIFYWGIYDKEEMPQFLKYFCGIGAASFILCAIYLIIYPPPTKNQNTTDTST